ncbi:UNVERIFIED_CONTAM: hypothetical protein ACS92_07200 [Bacillus cereus]
MSEREQVDEKLHYPHGNVHKRAINTEEKAAGDHKHKTGNLGHDHVDIQKVWDVGTGKNRLYFRNASMGNVVMF